MKDNRRNKTLFAASIFSAALTGALGEMEDYFDENQYGSKLASKDNDQQGNVSHH